MTKTVAAVFTLWLLLGLSPTAQAEVDRSRIIVRLVPSLNADQTITKGRSGRGDFDRAVAALKIERAEQLISPARTTASQRSLARRMGLHDFVAVTVPAGADPDAILAELKRSPDVEAAEFDAVVRAVGSAVVPNDTYFASAQYALRNTGTQPPFDPGTADADIDMDAAWEYTTGDSSIVLAIIDTGIDPSHPEFQGRLWMNPGEEFDEEDNDGNGFVDDGFGWNFINDNNATNDDNGHGTHVAGIAAGTGNNGIGIAGVNWHCRIMAVRVLGADGSGTASSVANGIVYAADEGAQVISMSLGHLGAPALVESTAVAYAESLGVIVVAAMGNDDVGAQHWPAAFNGVISVGATDSDDLRADPFCYSPSSGSNYGAWIDVCAPGDNVWSTYPVAWGGYANLCGTSMATPHVSGLISLMLGLRPGWPADSVLHILTRTADDQVGRPGEDTPGFDIYHGWGRINAAAALRVLSVSFAPVIDGPDSVWVTEGEPLAFGLTAFDSNLTALSFAISPLANAVLTDHGDGTATVDFLPDYTQSGEYLLNCTVTDGALIDSLPIVVTVANGCQCPCSADPACNGLTDVVDVISVIGVAFRGNDPILDVDCFPNPGGRTDVNCSGASDVVDVVRIIDVAFRGQAPTFCNPCDL
ncbi:MAG TPA: S8 family serine peptidase [bacterium]|nr:S8 family serine peptidase [bacterium]